MNRVLTSAIAFGAGIVASNMAQRNNIMNNKSMRKWQRKISKSMF